MSQRKVREIRNPSFPDMYKHVGVYCRVSTGSMPQLHSLAEQVSHYVQMLRARPPYKLYDITLMSAAVRRILSVFNTSGCCKTAAPGRLIRL